MRDTATENMSNHNQRFDREPPINGGANRNGTNRNGTNRNGTNRNGTNRNGTNHNGADGTTDGASTALVSTQTIPTDSERPQRSLELASTKARKPSKKQSSVEHFTEEQFRRLGESVLFTGETPLRVMGFTSAVAGEGRTFLAGASALALARSSGYSVVLVELDWDHPTFSASFNVPEQPGLAEWLRGEVDISRIRHTVAPNLTVVPAGDGRLSAALLVRRLRQPEMLNQLLAPEEIAILDLPPVLTCAYGTLAANVADAVVVVVRAGVTPESHVAQACSDLGDRLVRGVLLNQVHSSIPHWLRNIL